jgi:hypothetical protein
MNLNIIIIILLFLLYTFSYRTKTNILIQEFFTNVNTIKTISESKKITSIPSNLSQYFSKNISYKIFNLNQIKSNSKIFLSVASYRDPQCPLTVLDAITKASNPEKLVIVICQQNDLEDIECITTKTRGATIKYIKISNTQAKGPCWARFCINQMWDGEEYYLQIDSHTRFVESWDIKCIEELKQAQSIKGDSLVCLSNYVSTFNINTSEIEINPLRGPMYVESIDQTDGFYRYNSKYSTLMIQPQESKGWSGCFAFGPAQMLIDAPYDPYTPFLFFGEEMDIFARLYTRGWIMYVPHIPICFTIFDRSYRKTFWEHPEQDIIVPWSKIRLYERFGILSKEFISKIPSQVLLDKENFKLGTVKTFDQFLEYCAK